MDKYPRWITHNNKEYEIEVIRAGIRGGWKAYLRSMEPLQTLKQSPVYQGVGAKARAYEEMQKHLRERIA